MVRSPSSRSRCSDLRFLGGRAFWSFGGLHASALYSAADIISNPEPVLKTPRKPRHFWQKIMREVDAIYSKPKT